MLIFWLHLFLISVLTNDFDGTKKKIQLGKCFFNHNERNLTASNSS